MTPSETVIPSADTEVEVKEAKPKNRRAAASAKSRAAQSPLETYLREINETALLSAEDERELAGRIAQGDAMARDRMVRANLRLVVNIARRIHRQGTRAARFDRRGQSRIAASRRGV